MKKRLVFSILLATLCMSLVACSQLQIKTLKSTEEMLYRNYETVKIELEALGFSNVECIALEDLDKESLEQKNEVSLVTFDGKSDFSAGEKFSRDTQIIIEYHSVKVTKAPLSSKNAESTDVEKLEKLFGDAGFIRIKLDEVYDLNPQKTDADFKNEVKIGENKSFDKQDKFTIDETVTIITHKPYTPYNVSMRLVFPANKFFSTYDVDLYVDGELEYNLSHGESSTVDLKLAEGNHLFELVSAEAPETKGEFELEVYSDITASYTLTCESVGITVTTNYIDRKIDLAEDEVRAPSSAADFMLEDYDDVKTVLTKAGFTNIKTKPIYDIVLGWTESGEVKSVSIDGSTAFSRGDIFKKDAPVLITYHLPEEYDPNYEVSAEDMTTTEKATEDVTEAVESTKAE